MLGRVATKEQKYPREWCTDRCLSESVHNGLSIGQNKSKVGLRFFNSVRFGYGSCMERFERFRFSVPTVPLRKGFLFLKGPGGFGCGFGS